MTDHYNVLGVERNADMQTIREAYKRLVLIWHPDKNKTNDKQEVERMFKQISAAYSVLSDPQKRDLYDKNMLVDQNNNDQINQTYDPFEKLNEMFEDTEVPPVIVPVECTMVEAYHGIVNKNILFKRYSPCESCDATGSESKQYVRCRGCDGRGEVVETLEGGRVGFVVNQKKCNLCEGRGIDPDVTLCNVCEGNRYMVEEAEYDLDVPPGAHDKQVIKLVGEGNYIPPDETIESKSNINRTDVWFVIHTPDRETINGVEYRRGMVLDSKTVDNQNLLIEMEISLAESVCGFWREFQHLDNQTIRIRQEQPTMNGQLMVLRNRGMQVLDSKGDLIIRFRVNANQNTLNKKQQRRIWQILTGTGYNRDLRKEGELLIDFDKWLDLKNVD